MADEERVMPVWLGALIALGIAMAIAVAVGAIAGGFTGWSFGHWEEFILEQQQRARDAPGGLKRYVWVRTMQFALPMGVGGLVCQAVMSRFAHVSGMITAAPLAIGAAAGWLVGIGVLRLSAPDSAIPSTMFLAPAALFVIIPMVKVFKEEL